MNRPDGGNMWLFLLFVAVPMIEIALFIKVGGLIGLWPTLGIVVLTALVGSWLVHMQGAVALGRLRESLGRLEDPSEPLAHGAMILVAGVLLLTPGFFTDAAGILLLLPPVRAAVMKYVKARVKIKSFGINAEAHTYHESTGPIDADYTDVTPHDHRPVPPPGRHGH